MCLIHYIVQSVSFFSSRSLYHTVSHHYMYIVRHAIESCCLCPFKWKKWDFHRNFDVFFYTICFWYGKYGTLKSQEMVWTLHKPVAASLTFLDVNHVSTLYPIIENRSVSKDSKYIWILNHPKVYIVFEFDESINFTPLNIFFLAV